jgi:hypothetical protein
MNIWNWFLYHWIYCDEDETSTALNCADAVSSYDLNDDWWCNTSDDSSYTDWDSCYSS